MSDCSRTFFTVAVSSGSFENDTCDSVNKSAMTEMSKDLFFIFSSIYVLEGTEFISILRCLWPGDPYCAISRFCCMRISSTVGAKLYRLRKISIRSASICSEDLTGKPMLLCPELLPFFQ